VDGLAHVRRGEIIDRGHDIAHRLFQVRLQVASANNAHFGLKIDQDNGPLIKQADFRNDRTPQRYQHWPRGHRSQRECREAHDEPTLALLGRVGFLVQSFDAGGQESPRSRNPKNGCESSHFSKLYGTPIQIVHSGGLRSWLFRGYYSVETRQPDYMVID